MSGSPYQPPQATGYPSLGSSPDREQLRRVAKFQRWVLFGVLANILISGTIVGTAGQDATVRLPVFGIGLLITVILVFAVFSLAKEVYNIGMAIFCAISMFVPCLSLIMLLVVNQKATGFLQQSGIKVGFMGVNPNSIQ